MFHPLDTLYAQAAVLLIYALMIVFHRPFYHRANNNLELMMVCTLIVTYSLATSFGVPDAEDRRVASQEVYQIIVLGAIFSTFASALCVASVWFIHVLLEKVGRKPRQSEVFMLMKLRDLVLNSYLHTDLMQSANDLVDEDLRVLDAAFHILVPVLEKKQFTQSLTQQRIIPGATVEHWNSRRCTSAVMAGGLSGALFSEIQQNHRVRLNLYKLADALHSGEQSLSETLKEALRLTDSEVSISSKRGCIENYVAHHLSRGMVTKMAFTTAVASQTDLSDEDVMEIFDLVAGDTGKALAQDLSSLLTSAYATLPELNTHGRRSTMQSLAFRRFSNIFQTPKSTQQHEECLSDNASRVQTDFTWSESCVETDPMDSNGACDFENVVITGIEEDPSAGTGDCKDDESEYTQCVERYTFDKVSL
eukprot:TRINITY_DN5060_c0_g3_i2.p1 TRINITY_DN5060_c0_g3~~TRINITY_DN5060_c0_g3_i2.p1  ORF type:complete len:471 (+),score=64.28 TRINITY_DN5060_c0_g3_i2:154-1413(+)